MRRISTGEFAVAIKKHFPIITDDMVRSWAEAGLLKYWRTPLQRSWYFIQPESIPAFLREELKLNQDQIREVAVKLGLNFEQLALLLTA